MQGHRQQRPYGHPSTGHAREPQPNRADLSGPTNMQHPAFRQNPHHPAYDSWYDENDYIDAYAEDPEPWPLPAHASTDQHRAWSSTDVQSHPLHNEHLHHNLHNQPHILSQQQPQTMYHMSPPTQAYHGSGQWTEDDYEMAQTVNDLDGHQISPQSAQLQHPYGRGSQRVPLGPPPSARRGPASYYAHVAPVHPIFEEHESMRGSLREGTHSSYASSNAIPIGVPEYYLNREAVQDRQRPIQSAIEVDQNALAHTNELSGYRSDDDLSRYGPSPEPAPIVRQASLGKRSKPTLTTVQSSEKVRSNSSPSESGKPTLSSQQQQPSFPKSFESVYEQDTQPSLASHDRLYSEGDTRNDHDDHQRHKSKRTANNPRVDRSDDIRSQASDDKVLEQMLSANKKPIKYLVPYESTESFKRTPSSEVLAGATASDQSSGSDSEGVRSKSRVRPTTADNKFSPHHGQYARTRARSPLAPTLRESDIRKSLEAGTALEMTETRSGFLKAPMPGMSERMGKQRPPTLDMSKLKDAEARGSLTSLPDLIKRNMRLASNLDRGRTASRLGMEWFTSEGNKANARKSAGSLSEILSSFPAPGAPTPTGGRPNLRGSFATFSKSNVRHSTLPSDSDAPDGRKPQRRCCGMPLWLFIVVLIVLFLLVAAAVVVPVMLLVVVPNMHHGSSTPGSNCQAQLQCQNGGTGIVGQDGNCRCLCVNGYTGDNCNQSSAASCTTTTVGTIDGATVGDAIPRLLQIADSDFRIPLDGSTLLGLFSSNDLSCNTENSLVTFNGASARKRSVEDNQKGTPTIKKRQTSTDSPNGQATSNGIVYQTGSPSSTSDSSTDVASPSSTSQSSTSYNSSDTKDFARIAVLYVFQDSSELSSASSAQSILQSYFSSGQTTNGQQIDQTNVQLENGYSCNLDAFSLTLANGTVIGQQHTGKRWING